MVSKGDEKYADTASKCTLSVGQGKEEWGAEPGKEYFILTVQEIRKR